MSSCPVGNALTTERRPTSLPPPPKKASKLILREPAQAVAAPGAAEEREEGESGGRGDLFSLLGRRAVWLFPRSGGVGVGDSGTVPAVTDGLRHEIIQEAPEVY